MRLKVIFCGVTGLAPVLLLAGCGVERKLVKALNVDSPAITGRAMGARQPVGGATISARLRWGKPGYGSTGTVLASVTTDSGGNFSFDPGAYTCPQSDTPVYLLGIGGNTGAGGNSSAVLGAGLESTCAAGKNSFHTILNAVTTTALAFTLAHFFSPTLGGTGAQNDWFGGPSTRSQGLVMGNSVTIPAIVSNAVGAPNQDHTGYVVEAAKINTIANILANCVNTTGATDTTETTTPCWHARCHARDGAAVRPSDTLQAAVQMALHPATNVTPLFNLIVAQTPFAGLTAPPNDWTIGVGYTTSSLGLAADTGTLTTLDIDASGRIWFPSNAAGKTGAAYFDPASQSFNGPFNATGLVHPQQVAIDATGFAWYNDSAATTVGGYLVTNPTTTQEFSLPGTSSQSVTIANNNAVGFGITIPSLFELAGILPDRSDYFIVVDIVYSDPVVSMAGDANNDAGAVATSNPLGVLMRNYLSIPLPPSNQEILTANDVAGQVIFIGDDNVSLRSFSGTGTPSDGLCIYSLANCHDFTGALTNAVKGMVIDGARNLWVTENGDGGILQVPVSNPGAAGGAVYLSGLNDAPATEYLHGSGNGGTVTVPYGIGVDATGNVWVSNAGCNVTGCTPGSFTLTEIIGAATPTITRRRRRRLPVETWWARRPTN